MTTRKDGETLTRVGPGTPMGEMFRQYWFPAILSKELTADGDPVRLKLLGEQLIAFRDTAGKVGIMDHRCPHRCASMFYGRNEKGGIRCVYHGWKFDAEGNCTDMPNVPAAQDFKHKVHAKAYKTHEQNGMVWVFMGDQQNVPPFPLFEVAMIPEEEMEIVCVQRACNYLQALEGDIDTSHFGFLHAGSVDPAVMDATNPTTYAVIDKSPEYIVSDTDWGTMYAAHRDLGDGRIHWRTASFAFPFWTMQPDGPFEKHITARAWVPLDDEHTMFTFFNWKGNIPALRSDTQGVTLPDLEVEWDYQPNTTDWLGRWRLKSHEGNDYNIDRESQRHRSYTGIRSVHLQDLAITESMGPITDHGFEHLAPSDKMITQTRRRLLNAVKKFQETGEAPPTVETPEVFLKARSGDFFAPKGQDFNDAYQEQMAASANPTGKLVYRTAAE